MCWDSWNMKGDGEVMFWEERPPFSVVFTPGNKENKCPLRMEEKASGFTDNCPGLNNKGAPSLRSCWLGEPEKPEVWRWPALTDAALCVCNIIGRNESLMSLILLLEKSVSAEHMSCDPLNTVMSFVGSWVSLLFARADLLHSIASLFWPGADMSSVLDKRVSDSSSRLISESLPISSSSSSVGKKNKTLCSFQVFVVKGKKSNVCLLWWCCYTFRTELGQRRQMTSSKHGCVWIF